MSPMLRLLDLPLPVLAAMVVPQVAPDMLQVPDVPEGPSYIATGLLAVWVTLWFLDRIGKLPGRPQGERRNAAFTPEDRQLLARLVDSNSRLVEIEEKNSERTHRLYELLAFRDGDGIERFLKYLQEARDAHRVQRENNTLLKRVLQVVEKGGGI